MDQHAPAQDDRLREDRDEEEQEQKPVHFGQIVRAHPWMTAAAVIAVISAIVGGVLWWLDARHYEWTDDAFIDSRQFAISSKVAGYIADVKVTDNQRVANG